MNTPAPRILLDPRLKFFLRRSALVRRLLLPRLVRAHYLAAFGRPLNTRDPRAFTEKLFCAKLFPRAEKLAAFVDKYSVRRYVSATVGDRVLVPLLGVADHASDLDWDALPSAFVLKATHASGWNVIVRDKRASSRSDVAAVLDAWMGKSYFTSSLEPQYARIPPRIVAERFLGDPAEDPADYKFHCFGAEPRFIQMDADRSRAHTRILVDADWRPLHVRHGTPPPPASTPPRPRRFPEMMEIARRLAAPFPYVRVDLYAVDDEIFFGELTFTPANGVLRFSPPSFDLTAGAWFDLPAHARPSPVVERFFAAYP